MTDTVCEVMFVRSVFECKKIDIHFIFDSFSQNKKNIKVIIKDERFKRKNVHDSHY